MLRTTIIYLIQCRQMPPVLIARCPRSLGTDTGQMSPPQHLCCVEMLDNLLVTAILLIFILFSNVHLPGLQQQQIFMHVSG